MPDQVNDPERYEHICRKSRIDQTVEPLELAGRQRLLLPSPHDVLLQDSHDLGDGGVFDTKLWPAGTIFSDSAPSNVSFDTRRFHRSYQLLRQFRHFL